jgi:hypothetical protein
MDEEEKCFKIQLLGAALTGHMFLRAITVIANVSRTHHCIELSERGRREAILPTARQAGITPSWRNCNHKCTATTADRTGGVRCSPTPLGGLGAGINGAPGRGRPGAALGSFGRSPM